MVDSQSANRARTRLQVVRGAPGNAGSNACQPRYQWTRLDGQMSRPSICSKGLSRISRLMLMIQTLQTMSPAPITQVHHAGHHHHTRPSPPSTRPAFPNHVNRHPGPTSRKRTRRLMAASLELISTRNRCPWRTKCLRQTLFMPLSERH